MLIKTGCKGDGNMVLKEIERENRGILKPLFSTMHDALIQSCLQGHMGYAWADDENSPACAKVLVGDFAFLAGDCENPCAVKLVADIPSWYRSNAVLIVPETAAWGELIEKKHTGRFIKIVRYSVGHGAFDTELLRRFSESLPPGCSIRPIDKPLYKEVMKHDWSRDLCSLFESADDYARRGIGFCAVHNGEVACGASSYAIYDDGIEIEIDTRADHRRKGLATACAATLMLECLKRGLNPRWDAANMESVMLSEKLGYHLLAPYDTWAVACG